MMQRPIDAAARDRALPFIADKTRKVIIRQSGRSSHRS